MELLTAETFGDLVSEEMSRHEISAMDAVLEICRKRDLDIECIPELLNPKLKKVIQAEANKLHMIKKKKRKEECQDSPLLD